MKEQNRAEQENVIFPIPELPGYLIFYTQYRKYGKRALKKPDNLNLPSSGL